MCDTERQRQHGRRHPEGARRSGHSATWRPELYRARHRLLKASEWLTERDRRRLSALFAADPIIAEAWGLKEGVRRRAAARKQSVGLTTSWWGSTARSCPPSGAFAEGQPPVAQRAVAQFDEPTTNGYPEGVIVAWLADAFPP